MPGMPAPCCSALASLRTLESRSNQASSSARRRPVLFGEVALFSKARRQLHSPNPPDSRLILVYLFLKSWSQNCDTDGWSRYGDRHRTGVWTVPTAARWRRGESGGGGGPGSSGSQRRLTRLKWLSTEGPVCGFALKTQTLVSTGQRIVHNHTGGR